MAPFPPSDGVENKNLTNYVGKMYLEKNIVELDYRYIQVSHILGVANICQEVQFNIFLGKKSTLYTRGGQSAALQIFSAAPVSNFGCTTKLCMTNLCIKYPKFK